MTRDLVTRLFSAASKLGIEIIGIDNSRKRPPLVICVNGKVHRHPLPRTSTDRRTTKNNVAGFRRRVRDLRSRRH